MNELKTQELETQHTIIGITQLPREEQPSIQLFTALNKAVDYYWFQARIAAGVTYLEIGKLKHEIGKLKQRAEAGILPLGKSKAWFSNCRIPDETRMAKTEAEKRETLNGPAGFWPYRFKVRHKEEDKQETVVDINQKIVEGTIKGLQAAGAENKNKAIVLFTAAKQSNEANEFGVLFDTRGEHGKAEAWLRWVFRKSQIKDLGFKLLGQGEIQPRGTKSYKKVKVWGFPGAENKVLLFEAGQAVQEAKNGSAMWEVVITDENNLDKARDLDGTAEESRLPAARLVFIKDAEDNITKMEAWYYHVNFNESETQSRTVLEKVLADAGLEAVGPLLEPVVFRRNYLEGQPKPNIIDAAAGLELSEPEYNLFQEAKDVTGISLGSQVALASLITSKKEIDTAYICSAPKKGDLQLVPMFKWAIVRNLQAVVAAVLSNQILKEVEVRQINSVMKMLKIKAEEFDKFSQFLAGEMKRTKKGMGLLAFLGAHLPKDKQGLLAFFLPTANQLVAEGSSQVSSVQMKAEKFDAITFITALGLTINRGLAVNTIKRMVTMQEGKQKLKFEKCILTLRERLKYEKPVEDQTAKAEIKNNLDKFHDNLILTALTLILLKGNEEQKKKAEEYLSSLKA